MNIQNDNAEQPVDLPQWSGLNPAQLVGMHGRLLQAIDESKRPKPPSAAPKKPLADLAQGPYFALCDIYNLLNKVVWNGELPDALFQFRDGSFMVPLDLKSISSDGEPILWANVKELAATSVVPSKTLAYCLLTIMGYVFLHRNGEDSQFQSYKSDLLRDYTKAHDFGKGYSFLERLAQLIYECPANKELRFHSVLQAIRREKPSDMDMLFLSHDLWWKWSEKHGRHHPGGNEMPGGYLSGDASVVSNSANYSQAEDAGRTVSNLPPLDRKEAEKGIDELFTYARQYRNGARFRELLEFCASFRNVAPYNAMMVHIQKPGAKYVLSARGWRKYNRVPRINARPLVILWPFGPVQYWFDVGDTAVAAGVEDKFPPELVHPYDGDPTQPVPVERRNILVDNLPIWGIGMQTMRAGPDFSGEIRVVDSSRRMTIRVPVGDQRPGRSTIDWQAHYMISVREGSTPAEEFSAIVHELGHLFCRHLPANFEKGGWQWRNGLSHESKEFEAETVSWLVCQRLGVRDTRAYAYLAEYLQVNGEIPDVSIDAIFQATRLVETMLHPCTASVGYLNAYEPSFREALKQMRT